MNPGLKIFLLGEFDTKEIVPAPIKVGKELFNAFIKLGLEVYYLPYFQDGKIYSRIQKLFGYEKISDKVYRVGIIRLITFVLKNRPQIIHIITPALYYVFLFPLKNIFRFKVVATLHSINRYYIPHHSNIKGYNKFRFLLIEKLLVKFSDKIFVYSNREKRYVSRYYKILGLKIKVVNNGINLYDIKKESFDINSCLKIAFIGNVNRKEKAFNLLVEVLLSIDFPIKLSIFSPDKQDELNITSTKNIEVNRYKPLIERELRKELTKNDLFILPSNYESFSLSLLEAMNVGLSIIISSRVGMAERFSQDMKKMIFKNNDFIQIREMIFHFLSLKSDERHQIAINNINFTKNHTWENVSADYIKIYRELVKQ